MDLHSVRPLPGLPAAAVLSGLLGRLLRRPPLRAEGRLAAHPRTPPETVVSKLVPAALPARLCEVPAGGPVTAALRALTRNDAASDFAAEVRSGLGTRGVKQLPSKYFYDDL